jgi:hypothetical protein
MISIFLDFDEEEKIESSLDLYSKIPSFASLFIVSPKSREENTNPLNPPYQGEENTKLSNFPYTPEWFPFFILRGSPLQGGGNIKPLSYWREKYSKTYLLNNILWQILLVQEISAYKI